VGGGLVLVGAAVSVAATTCSIVAFIFSATGAARVEMIADAPSLPWYK
jgi:hypothetical protein